FEGRIFLLRRLCAACFELLGNSSIGMLTWPILSRTSSSSSLGGFFQTVRIVPKLVLSILPQPLRVIQPVTIEIKSCGNPACWTASLTESFPPASWTTVATLRSGSPFARYSCPSSVQNTSVVLVVCSLSSPCSDSVSDAR